MDAFYAENIFAPLVLAILVFVLLMCAVSHFRRPNRSPPGPPAWPIVGHLHLFGKDYPVYRTLYALAERYGPVMHLQIGCRPILVVSSAEMARECLTTNDRIFASRPAFAIGEHLGYGNTMLGLSPYDCLCQNLRKICQAEIRTSVEKQKQVRAEEVRALAGSLFQLQRGGDQVIIQMRPRLRELTFSIIARLVAGKRYFGPNANQTHADEGRALMGLIEQYTVLFGAFNIGDYLPWIRWLDLQGFERSMKILCRRSDALLQRLVDEHRIAKAQKLEHTADGKDMIDVLLSEGLSDSVVKATAMILIGAGTDTPSAVLEWALASLIGQPEICRNAQEELDALVGRERLVDESDLPRLEYVEAVVKETLRLYPPGPLLVPHESTEGCRVGGYYIPRGTRLVVNAWGIHRDPSVWQRPLEFRPERFMKASIDVGGQHLELIPFGSGRRACPGAPLALRVVRLTVATLLQCFDWSAPAEMDLSEGHNGVTLPKAVPLEAVVKARLPCYLYQPPP